MLLIKVCSSGDRRSLDKAFLHKPACQKVRLKETVAQVQEVPSCKAGWGGVPSTPKMTHLGLGSRRKGLPLLKVWSSGSRPTTE